MITARVYGGDAPEVLDDLDRIAAAVADPAQLTWIDACDLVDDEMDALRRMLDLHDLEVEDIRERGQRAKLETYADHVFMVVYGRAGSDALAEVDLAVGSSWVLTVRERNAAGAAFSVEDVPERFERLRSGDRSVGFLLYALLDTVVDEYFDLVDRFEDRLEAIEQVLFDKGPPPSGQIQHDLLRLRRRLIAMRRRVVPMRDVVMAILRRELPYVEDDALLYFEDVLDHLLRLIDQIDTSRELMGNVVDASLALSANRMNLVMKKMTSWGAILIVATLVTGVYGMNFENMPELSWRFGYLAALGTMVLATGGLYAWFKHKDWL